MPVRRPLLCTAVAVGISIWLTCPVFTHAWVALVRPPARALRVNSHAAVGRTCLQLQPPPSRANGAGSAPSDVACCSLPVPRAASPGAAPRRSMFASAVAAAGLAAAAPVSARQAVEVDFSVDLPSSKWKVKTQIKQAIRLTKEKVYEAFEKSTGASVSVTRTPIALNKDRGGTDRLQELSGAFDETVPTSKEDVVDVLTRTFTDPVARRQRKWMHVERFPDIEDYKGLAGQRYVGFSYSVRECKGTMLEFKDGGSFKYDCDGTVLPPRRHFVTATVMPTVYTSMRKQEGEADRSTLVDSLWLLDASAPMENLEVDNVGAALEKTARSFSVVPPEPENLKRCSGKTMTECFGEAWSGRGTLYRGTDRASLSGTFKADRASQ